MDEIDTFVIKNQSDSKRNLEGGHRDEKYSISINIL